MRKSYPASSLLFLSLYLCFSAYSQNSENIAGFSPPDIQFLKHFTLDALPKTLPDSMSNRYADNEQAATFGKKIFFDKRFSRGRSIACSTCHSPQLYFTDGLRQAAGLALTDRNAPSLLGASYSPWFNWDGSKDSIWSQALGPLENLKEHGLNRLDVANIVIAFYLQDYEKIFGELKFSTPISEIKTQSGEPLSNNRAWLNVSEPIRHEVTRIFVNVGKSLMAYQRKLNLLPSRFDRFVRALEKPHLHSDSEPLLSDSEIKGLRIFMGKGACASCHNGPLFTNFEFHNTGVPEANIDKVDLGRYRAIPELESGTFTCLSPWSDANIDQCEEMQFLKKQGQELVGAFKTPSLRNVEKTAPYMHSGQISSLEAVVEHYNTPKPPFFDPKQHPSRPHFDILPLNLTAEEQSQLVDFLKTLTSPLPNENSWWFKDY